LCEANNCYWLNFNTTCTAAAPPASSPDSSNSQKLGLAIGLPVGIVVLATVVVFVLLWQHRRRKPLPKVKTYNGIYDATGGYVTTIVVKDGADPLTITNTNEEYMEMEENPGAYNLQNSSSIASVV